MAPNLTLLNTAKIINITALDIIYDEIRVAYEYLEMYENKTEMPVEQIKSLVSSLIDSNIRSIFSQLPAIAPIPENDDIDWQAVADYLNGKS